MLTGAVESGYTVNTWYGSWNVNAFTGTIDGAGHTVNGLYYEKEAAKTYSNYCGGVGLIPKASNVTIKNLAVDNSYLHHESTTSAFVAAAPKNSVVNLDSCYAGENVFLKAQNVGALRGFASSEQVGASGGTFINCYSLATLDAVSDSGLLGYNWDNAKDILVIKNCYNAKGTISTMVDTWYYGNVQGCYETAASGFNEGNTLLTAEQMQGENALNNMSTLNNYGNYYVATETYPTLSVFKGIEVKEVWNGTTSKPTQTDDKGNILINNGAELAYIIENGGAAGANYKLTADIYLNNLDKINWATGEVQSGYVPNQWYEGVAFQGNIDGNGHVVYGLYVSTDTAMATEWGYAECYGLIPLVAHGTTATVKKLGIDKAYLKAANSVGAFVGYAGSKINNKDADYANVSIDQCYVGAEVYLNSFDAGAFVGGNLRASITITNSYSLGTANDVAFAKSCFIADNYKSVFAIRNCYNANGTIFGAWDKENIDVNCANNYATGYDLVKEDKGPEAMYATMIDAENMKGHDVFTDKAKMPTLNTTGKFVAEEGYPTLVVFLGYEINVDEAVWDGTTSAPTVNSDGVYEIGTAEEFAYIIENGGAAGATYKLTSDIYLNSPDYINWSTGEVTRGYIPNSWYYNTFFQGNIDGDGHTVYGLYYNETGVAGWRCEGVGLIPHANSGTSVNITNLAVDKSYVAALYGVSAFVGMAGPTSNNEKADYVNVTIENCYVGKNVTLRGGAVGAFRGGALCSNTTIKNCYTMATTTSLDKERNAAGIFGNEWHSNITLRNVFNANGGAGGEDTVLHSETINKNFSGVYVTSNLAGDGKEYGSEAVTVLTAKNMQGRDVFENPNKLYNLNSDNAFESTTGYPILVSFIKDVVNVPVEDEKEIAVWDGTISAPVANSEGVYEITNGAELAYVIYNDGTINGTAACSFILKNDIYLNDITKVNWTTGEAIDANYKINSWFRYWKCVVDGKDVYHAFAGTIDGDGHTIYGLYFNMPNEGSQQYDAAALIPSVAENATVTIKNLAVDKAYVNYANGASAFVGYALTGSTVNISNSYANSDVTLIGNDAGVFRAVAKSASGANIENCYSLATVTGKATYGLTAFNWDAAYSVKFVNCYNANGPLSFGAGPGYYCTAENSYATVDSANADGGYPLNIGSNLITDKDMQGLDVFTADGKMSTLNSAGAYIATEGYPVITIFARRGNSGALRIWNGETMAPINGSGTEEDPYLIYYASELAYIISTGGAANTYYKLTNNIYLNNIYMIDWATGEAAEGYTPNNWYENIPFQGNIDGNGFIVYGLYYNDGHNFDEPVNEGVKTPEFGWYYNSGLIPRVNDGTSVSITNLGIDNAFVHSYQGASAFVGFAGTTSNYKPEVKAQVTIDNCYAGAKVYLEGGCTGVFRACTKDSVTTITNSYTLANTTGVVFDGLVGNAWDSTTTIRNVYNANGPVATKKEASSANTIVSNVYATDNTGFAEGVAILDKNQMLGVNALDVMSGLSTDTFKAVPDYYPVLNKFAQNKLVKNNRLYYGVAINDALDFYSTASGEQYFWRYDNILVNNDSSMDVSDLVLLMLQSNAGTAKADIDGDGNSTTDDLKIFRKALIGKTDYVNNPMYSVGEYTPVTTSLSADYQFVWGDEFDGDVLDSRKWGIYAKMNGSSIYEKENEDGTKTEIDYTGDVVNSSGADAIAVEDGNLRLTAYKTEDGKYVTPTSVVTQNTMNFKYGYVEIRAKFPVQDGIWSSWWTKSVFDKSDTNNLIQSPTKVGAEVDMIEVFDTNQATFNIIKWWEVGDDEYKEWYPNDAPSAHRQEITSDRYYVFGYEWTEDDKIRMYCDGVLYGEYDVSVPYTEVDKERDNGTLIANGVNNKFADKSGTDMECFDAHQYLIFNNHLFYPSISDAGMFITENTDFTRADYLIDYCRVYQKPGASDIVTK